MWIFSSKKRHGNRYRSKRSVRRQEDNHSRFGIANWTKTKIALVSVGFFVMVSTTLLPVILVEYGTSSLASSSSGLGGGGSGKNNKNPISLDNLVQKSIALEEEYRKKGSSFWKRAKDTLGVYEEEDNDHPSLRKDHAKQQQQQQAKPHQQEQDNKIQRGNVNNLDRTRHDNTHNKEHVAKDDSKLVATVAVEKKKSPSKKDKNNNEKKKKKPQLARGVSGLPMSKTPALIGARPGHVQCDVNVDDIVYWNDPQGTRDRNFQSPFKTPSPTEKEEYYLSFQPDPGGWNNVRMSMEVLFVLAAATGRTLVLPPKTPYYLFGQGVENVRSIGDFYPLDHPDLKHHLKMITMEEFLQREGTRILNLTSDQVDQLRPTSEKCIQNPDSEICCEKMYVHLRKAGYQPDMGGFRACLVFDIDHFHGKSLSGEVAKKAARFCGEQRKPVYYDQILHAPKLIHWDTSGDNDNRILNHFYSFIYFSDPSIDNFYKRFIRDFLHYKDDLFCAAGKIIHALNSEEYGWSSLHVRRGDLQYKVVKIPAEEWYNDTKEIWNDKETLFIATDEANRTFFDPLQQGNHKLRFLNDYWEVANLSSLDPRLLGMVDTIVASHGRAFAGTWFSTFSGYINRMRGYLGHSMKNSWYGWLERKDAMHEWKFPTGNYPAREWPIGWVAIDGDEVIEHEGTPVDEPFEEVKTVGKSELKSLMQVTLSDLKPDNGFKEKPLSRGIAGRLLLETPALVGASRAHIECDINIDSLAYWNDPQGKRDQEFKSPFLAKGEEKYITFTVDRGGWNNVRMSMEIIFVIAVATGRTLVLPPKEPIYRLAADKENKYRGFADFFPLDTPEFAKRLKTISMAEFVKREGGPGGHLPIPDAMKINVHNSADHCEHKKMSPSFCGHIADYLGEVAYVPNLRAQDYCAIFDKDIYAGKRPTNATEESISHFCGGRNRTYWTSELQAHPVIHFKAGDKKWRLLTHFYAFIHFTDPAIDNYYKRFVRDFLHYHDHIYCAAGKIVKALQVEAIQRGFQIDDEGGGGFSAMHIRRGDLQYKKVKIPAEEWYENTKEIWQPKEILYIATDERNKTFFDPIAEHHDLRFLDDYFELASLNDLDPNYFGMLDTIVASRARAFAGTFFSTFTGYINRMRGYHGMSMMDSWYSYLPRKTKMHTWEHVNDFAYAYEWPTGWVGIDADVIPSKDKF